MSFQLTTQATGDDALYSTANTTPSLDLRFATNKVLNDYVTGSNLITFTRASSATYVDSAGVIQTATTNVARFDHNPTTGESLGLLVEEARTNLALHNRDLTNAAWVKSNITAAKDQAGVTGGSNTASSITATGANGTVLQTITSASAARATSAYVKRITGTGTIEMTQDNGTTWTAITVTSAWTRVTIPSATVTNPVVGFRIVTNGDAIAVDFVQLETGAFSTSAIETTTASVTRSADVASITGSSFTGWYRQDEGTMFVGWIKNGASNFQAMATISDSTTNNIISLGHGSGAPSTNTRFDINVANVSQASLTLVSPSSVGTAYRTAGAYKLDDFAASVNGGSSVTDTSGAIPTASQLVVGANGAAGGGFLNGTIRRLTYWPQRLPNATLQSITT